ncbi:MAG: hypothetical protein IBJ10_02230 [Phycisphaerales bacterium]|nr:hypothetical protein [Phycisphaerales bacterium]
MKTFIDNQGRKWSVQVDVSTIKRVRGLAGVDLLDVLGGKLIDRLIVDPILLCDVIYAVCKPQADDLGVSDETFGAAMAGDTIEHATQALLDEIVSFSPNPRDRAALGKVLAATSAAMDKARDLIDESINSGTMQRAIDAAVAPLLSTHGASSGGAPASPASTPPP